MSNFKQFKNIHIVHRFLGTFPAAVAVADYTQPTDHSKAQVEAGFNSLQTNINTAIALLPAKFINILSNTNISFSSLAYDSSLLASDPPTKAQFDATAADLQTKLNNLVNEQINIINYAFSIIDNRISYNKMNLATVTTTDNTLANEIIALTAIETNINTYLAALTFSFFNANFSVNINCDFEIDEVILKHVTVNNLNSPNDDKNSYFQIDSNLVRDSPLISFPNSNNYIESMHISFYPNQKRPQGIYTFYLNNLLGQPVSLDSSSDDSKQMNLTISMHLLLVKY